MPDYPSPSPPHVRLDIYRCFAFAISTVGPSNNVHYHSTSTQPNQTFSLVSYLCSSSPLLLNINTVCSLSFGPFSLALRPGHGLITEPVRSVTCLSICHWVVCYPFVCSVTYNCFTVLSGNVPASSLLHHCHVSPLFLTTDSSPLASLQTIDTVIIRILLLTSLPHLAFLFRKTSQWLPTDAALGRSTRISGLSTW